MSRLSLPNEPLSKLLAIPPIVVPYIIPYITPLRSLDYSPNVGCPPQLEVTLTLMLLQSLQVHLEVVRHGFEHASQGMCCPNISKYGSFPK